MAADASKTHPATGVLRALQLARVDIFTPGLQSVGSSFGLRQLEASFAGHSCAEISGEPQILRSLCLPWHPVASRGRLQDWVRQGGTTDRHVVSALRTALECESPFFNLPPDRPDSSGYQQHPVALAASDWPNARLK